MKGPVEAKRVEEAFVREGRILHLHIAGRVIRTTPEHPFYVKGRGWTTGAALESGALLSTHDGRWVELEDLLDTGEVETVYNMRVADYHTYFVGSHLWQFSVWVHNTYLGDLGETAAKGWLKRHDYTDVVPVQNRSGHGIDLIARHRDGTLTFFEVKTSASRVAPSLSAAQDNAIRFIRSRLTRAASGGPWWRSTPKAVRDQAQQLLDEIDMGTTFRRYVIEITNATNRSTPTHFVIKLWK